jgi:hypothetical protein
MASIIKGTSNGNIEIQAGAGQSIVFTTDSKGSIDLEVLATEGFVTSQISNIIGSAPEALDTLNELAEALGDNENFASTVTSSLASKADSSTSLEGYGILNAYTQTEIDDALLLKANSEDVYTQTEIDDALLLKANSEDVYTQTEIDQAFSDLAIGDYYTSTEVDTAITNNNVDFVNVGLSGKADAFVEAPVTSLGQAGDEAGMIAIDGSYIYYCVADYDATTDIWARTELITETW